MGENAVVLDDVADPQPHRILRAQAGEVAAVEHHATGLLGQQTGNGAEQSAFARAVRPQDGDQFAPADRDIDTVQHAQFAVAGRQPGHEKQWLNSRDRHR